MGVASVPSMLGDRRDRIRHEGPVHVWRQIADDITADVRARRLAKGQRLPTYADMADSYGVAVATVQRAMLELRREGVVTVAVGRGTFIAEK